GHLLLELGDGGLDPRLRVQGLLEQRGDPLGVALELAAAGPARGEAHLVAEGLAVSPADLRVLDEALGAEADLDLARRDHLAEGLHLLAVERELALVLGQLLLEAGDARRIADDVGLRPLVEHAAQAVDGGLERVDLEVEALERLRRRVPLLERLALA